MTRLLPAGSGGGRHFDSIFHRIEPHRFRERFQLRDGRIIRGRAAIVDLRFGGHHKSSGRQLFVEPCSGPAQAMEPSTMYLIILN